MVQCQRDILEDLAPPTVEDAPASLRAEELLSLLDVDEDEGVALIPSKVGVFHSAFVGTSRAGTIGGATQAMMIEAATTSTSSFLCTEILRGTNMMRGASALVAANGSPTNGPRLLAFW